jgi:hypothetical protein
MLVGDTVQERFVELVNTPSATVPANPLTGETVTVEPPEASTRTPTLVGLALIEKPITLKVTATVWERLPLVPVTVTCKVPGLANVHDRAELPEPATLVGVSMQDVLLLAKPTTPPKPLSPETVIVDPPALPALTVTLVGLADSVKSVTWTVTMVNLDSEPLALVTFAE